MALPFPAIDPIAVQLGPLAVRWYALAYVAGMLLGLWRLSVLNAKTQPPLFSKKALDDILVYAVLGVIIGGRIGYVLFYNLPYYIENPGDTLKIWHGGMAFHGGFLGVLAAFWLFAKRHKLPYFAVMDLVASITPIGLFFGRIANFINGELYGRVTDMSWAVMFPSGDFLPRHASQLYEAALEGGVLFVILQLLIARPAVRARHGVVSAAFLVGYGSFRLAMEPFREPDAQLGFITELAGVGITMGQALSLPMILAGIVLFYYSMKPSKARA